MRKGKDHSAFSRWRAPRLQGKPEIVCYTFHSAKVRRRGRSALYVALANLLPKCRKSAPRVRVRGLPGLLAYANASSFAPGARTDSLIPVAARNVFNGLSPVSNRPA